jgi:hypothetical protein
MGGGRYVRMLAVAAALGVLLVPYASASGKTTAKGIPQHVRRELTARALSYAHSNRWSDPHVIAVLVTTSERIPGTAHDYRGFYSVRLDAQHKSLACSPPRGSTCPPATHLEIRYSFGLTQYFVTPPVGRPGNY